MPETSSRIDIRNRASRSRPALAFSALGRHMPDEALEFVEDYGSKPLPYPFSDQIPTAFAQQYAERSPDTWHLAIPLTCRRRGGYAKGRCRGSASSISQATHRRHAS